MSTENVTEPESEEETATEETMRKSGWAVAALSAIVAFVGGLLLGVVLPGLGGPPRQEGDSHGVSHTGDWKLEYMFEEPGGASGSTIEINRIEYYPSYILVETPYGGQVFPINRLRKFNYYKNSQ